MTNNFNLLTIHSSVKANAYTSKITSAEIPPLACKDVSHNIMKIFHQLQENEIQVLVVSMHSCPSAK